MKLSLGGSFKVFIFLSFIHFTDEDEDNAYEDQSVDDNDYGDSQGGLHAAAVVFEAWPRTKHAP